MSKRIVSPRNGFLNEDRWIETRPAKNKAFIGFMGNQSFIGGEDGASFSLPTQQPWVQISSFQTFLFEISSVVLLESE